MLRRCLMLCALMASCGYVAAADDDAPWKDLVIHPQAVSDPIFNVRIFPDAAARQPGNAVPIFLRLAWETRTEMWEKIAKAVKYLEVPFDELNVEELRKEVPLYRYEELKRAAFREHAEWEYPLHDPGPTYEILLPDVQQSRLIMQSLSAHCRADIKEGKIDAAMEKITVGLGMVEHFEETPFLVVKLVQAINIDLFLDRIEELQQTSGAPNLYWALLTMLPDPLIDLRPVVDWERQMLLSAAPELKDLDRRRSPEEWGKIAARLTEAMNMLGFMAQENDEPQRRRQSILTESYIKQAREQLPKLMPTVGQRVKEMTDEEVAVRYFLHRYLSDNDRALRSLLLPPWHATDLMERGENQRKMWASEAPVQRFWSIKRRVEALKIVEGLRDYAAQHGGELPESLLQLSDTPAPTDSMSPTSFEYRREDNVGYLSFEPVSVNGVKRYGIKYRITVK